MNATSRASRREPVSSPELTRPGPPGSSPAGSQLRSARRASARVHPAHVSGPSSGRPRGATTLFEVPFASAMSELDLALWSVRWTSRFACTPRCILVLTAPRSCALTTTPGCSWSAVRPRNSGCSGPEPGVTQHRRASTNATWWPPAARTSSTLPSPFPSAYAPARPTPRTVHSDEPPINVSPGFAAAWWAFNSVAS